MYFTKVSSVNGKYYKRHISRTVTLKLVIKYSYDINGKCYFCRNAKNIHIFAKCKSESVSDFKMKGVN